jgi:hypothetical protein
MKKKIDPYFLKYQDRGMKKWATAFSLPQLTKAIHKTKNNALRDIKRLPQQNIEHIEKCLERSIKYNKILEIQLNTLDSDGRVKEHVWGNFRGFCDLDIVMIGDRYIDYADIRHVMIHDFRKWSTTEPEATNPFEKNRFEGISKEYQECLKDMFIDYFDDENWIE